jgi:hypothetical protein
MKHTDRIRQIFTGGLVLLLMVGLELREASGYERPTNPEIGPSTRFLIFGVAKISYAGGALGAGLDEGSPS